MVSCHIGPRLLLDFWFETTRDEAKLFVKKHSDVRSLEECEKYAVLSIYRTGEVKRHEGLPLNWGFQLTDKRKIREIR